MIKYDSATDMIEFTTEDGTTCLDANTIYGVNEKPNIAVRLWTAIGHYDISPVTYSEVRDLMTMVRLRRNKKENEHNLNSKKLIDLMEQSLRREDDEE